MWKKAPDSIGWWLFHENGVTIPIKVHLIEGYCGEGKWLRLPLDQIVPGKVVVIMDEED